MDAGFDASTYSVIQRSLEQSVTLQQLEEASMQVPTIARADCIRIHRLLAGIFISRLSRPEALAFQRGLAGQGIESDVVRDAQLPPLPSGVRSMRVWQEERAIHCRDVMERVTVLPVAEILFIAAGVIVETRHGTETVRRARTGPRGGMRMVPETRRTKSEETCVIADLFFTRPPYRFTFRAGESSRFFVQDQPVRPNARDMVAWAFQKLRSWAPAGCRLNRHIHHENPMDHPVGKTTYEEEIRWRFYRLRNPA